MIRKCVLFKLTRSEVNRVLYCFQFFCCFWWQSKSHVELELDTYKRKLDTEINSHKETIQRFNADKKDILLSKEEARTSAINGWFCSPNTWDNVLGPNKGPMFYGLAYLIKELRPYCCKTNESEGTSSISKIHCAIWRLFYWRSESNSLRDVWLFEMQ